MINIDDAQQNAIDELKSGKILCGDVGSGKSRTALAYFVTKECATDLNISTLNQPKDLYILTTAQKRDKHEWEDEWKPFDVQNCSITIDSWNNIKKYIDIQNAFFIFDEQRLVGSGAWVKTFYQIAKHNNWILLSATPGDCWSDYIPVFVANGFYKNKTEFTRVHCVYSRYSKFPKIDKYLHEDHLSNLRDYLLVDIEYHKHTTRHYSDILVDYDMLTLKSVMKNRFNIFTNEPIKNHSEFCYVIRKIVNSSSDRSSKIKELLLVHPKVIIFYNFDYELDILRQLCEELKLPYSEWNGHKHEKIPDDDKWAYLVQYTAGCEGWNCIITNVIIFYSLNYSYRVTMQAAGRIDRRNTQYTDLYYYYLKSSSWIDRAIKKAIDNKKTFNESRYFQSHGFA